MIRNKRILLEQDEDGTPHLMVRSFKVLPMNMIYCSLLQLLSKNFPVTKKLHQLMEKMQIYSLPIPMMDFLNFLQVGNDYIS